MNGMTLVNPNVERIDRTIEALQAERRRLAAAQAVVAYQGAPGAFSEAAARQLAGGAAVLAPRRTLDDVFEALAAGVADFAVIPLENTIAGPVPRAGDLVHRHRARVRGELSMHIAHALIGAPGAALADVRRVTSHPMALRQCAGYLARTPTIAVAETYDTAGAVAEIVAAGDESVAAIASAAAATIYGGTILAEGIQDRPDNFTRFVILTLA